MALVQRMKKALQRGRSVALPPEPDKAAYVLLPYVVQDQIKIVTELLGSSSSFNVNHQFGRAQRTLLHSAANTGAIDSLTYLLKKGAVVNVLDRIRVTPLILAARNGHKRCVHKLMDHGADISLHDNEGLTALHWLACNGRIELLVSILQKGEFVDVVDVHGHTALHVACQNGHYKCVVQLLDFKADINRTNSEGRTPLFFACRHGQLKCVNLLLKKGAHITMDSSGVSPLEVCVENGYKECVEALLLKDPEQVHLLLSLVKRDSIALQKVQSTLDFVCGSNSQLMGAVVSHLASHTCTAGMELLSTSSSYQDMMPQFLRCIQVLCHVYPHYQQAFLPPFLKTSSGTGASGGGKVKRTDSFGSTTDKSESPRSRLFGSFSGHRRAGSQSSQTEFPSVTDQQMLSVSLGSLGSIQLPQDPLEQLETVWTSLSSWFDLLLNELEKLDSTSTLTLLEESPADASREELKKEEEEEEVKLKPAIVEDLLSPIDSFPLPNLAAAIVNSAPPERRLVFLKPNISFDELEDEDKKLKRRSWHVERVASRFLMREDSESSSSLPTLMRSLSANGDKSFTTDSATNKSDAREPSPDLVGVYADRLAAVTHAFSLVCKTVQESRRRTGLLPQFLVFVDKYEAVMKVLLARKPQLIFAHFHFLLESTELIKRFMHIVHAQPFEDRKKWFYENLYSGNPPSNQLILTSNDSEIIVDRDNLFHSSCTKLSDAPVDRLREGLMIRFEGEAGMGSGVHREWFDDLSREILNPDYALFTQSADGATFQPNSHSDVNPDHLSYFQFAGRTMALAIYHQQLLNVYFTRSFYKHILGVPVSYHDLESIDPEYASSLQWLLDNEIDSLDLELYFSLETDVFGATEVIQLKNNGAHIPVNDENKQEYVQLVTDLRMTQAIGPQIRSFLEGFYALVPQHLIALFDEYELELLMSGLPEIDIVDWEKNTEYSVYTEDSEIVKWFWEVVKEFDKKDLAVLLQFVTGSSRVPLGGFSSLVGATGLTKFTISMVDYTPSRLPMASTCFNLLKLPEYPTKELLKDRLQFALTCGNGLIDIT